jgi:hypothetical protein
MLSTLIICNKNIFCTPDILGYYEVVTVPSDIAFCIAKSKQIRKPSNPSFAFYRGLQFT